MAEKEIKQEGDFKIKKKPKKLTNKPSSVTKVNLSKKSQPKKEEENAVPKQETTENVSLTSSESQEEGKETKVELQEVGSTHSKEQTSSDSGKSEEQVDETKKEKEVVEIEVKEKEPEISVKAPEQTKLPENIEKLVEFMNSTGGSVEDYVNLNKNYDDFEDSTLLKEYYKNSKPHLSEDEIDFLLDDKYSMDENVYNDRELKKRSLALKEEVANAKSYLTEKKNKYYTDIKNNINVSADQQKAIDFFNRYNQEQELANQKREYFTNNTNKYFKEEFKGFEFDLGEKKFNYKVSNPEAVASNQMDISTFIKKFLNEDGMVNDYQGYHKAIYAARCGKRCSSFI